MIWDDIIVSICFRSLFRRKVQHMAGCLCCVNILVTWLGLQDTARPLENQGIDSSISNNDGYIYIWLCHHLTIPKSNDSGPRQTGQLRIRWKLRQTATISSLIVVMWCTSQVWRDVERLVGPVGRDQGCHQPRHPIAASGVPPGSSH